MCNSSAEEPWEIYSSFMNSLLLTSGKEITVRDLYKGDA